MSNIRVARCKTCEYAATEAKAYPCNRCEELQLKTTKDLIDFYQPIKVKESV